MNKKNYINSMDQLGISKDFNERTEMLMKETLNKNNNVIEKHKTYFNTKKLAVSFAGLALVVAVGAFTWNSMQNGTNSGNNNANNTLMATESDEENATVTDTQNKGYTIPTIELAGDQGSDSTVAMDMRALFVYKGRIYVQSASSFQKDAQYLINKDDVMNLRGELIGKTIAGINEWSKQDDYAKEFASTIGEASIYTVKGYDSQYRLMAYYEYEDGFDAQIYDSLGGLTLNTGADFFELLKLKDNIKTVQWESFDSWNNGMSEYKEATVDSIWNNFINALYTSTPIGEDSDLLVDTMNADNQKFIHIKNNDNLITSLRLVKGGFVYVQDAGFFQVDEATFLALWDSIPVETAPTQTSDAAAGCDLAQAEVLLPTDTYPVGTESLSLIIKNNSDKELFYGMEYQMEQEIDGAWVPVPAVSNLNFIEIAKILAPNSKEEFMIDLTMLDPQLEAGKYRIIKTIDGQVCQAEFTLTK